MDRLKNIVVAVDFSACSRNALMQAARIARWNGARLQALHVVDSSVVSDLASALRVPAAEVQAQAVHTTAHELEHWVQAAGGGAEVSILTGSPIHEILQRVRAVAADLLVAGARSDLDQAHQVGPLAGSFLRNGPGKVLLVNDGGAASFRKIVVCVDFSPTAHLAVEQARRMASREGCEINCLHVYNPLSPQWPYGTPPREVTAELKQQHADALQAQLAEFVGQPAGLDLRCHVVGASRYGQGIAGFARQNQADLIIVGTRGRTNLRYVTLGSTAERLLRVLPCSVLAIRASEAEDAMN